MADNQSYTCEEPVNIITMAELADQIKSGHLTCTICQHCFTNPKALPCQHSFCEDCLRDYIFSRSYEQSRCFPCPECREEIQIPNMGVAGLPDNEYLNSLMETVKGSTAGQGDRERRNMSRSNRYGNHTPPQVHRASVVRGEGDSALGISPDPPNRLYPDLSNFSSEESNPTGLSYLQQMVPVTYAVDNALVCFGRYGPGLAEFTLPIGMCVSGKHRVPLIHVTDQRNNRVLTFSLGGELKSVFSCEGEIYDISCDMNDTLYIANAKANRALALTYNLGGQKTGSYGNHYTFVKPHGIGVNKQGEVIVTTLENKCFVLGQNGKTLQEFGRKTKGKEGFISPYYVAINSKSDIIISDRDSNRIKIFDKTGKSKSIFGQYGCNKGELDHPLGVDCDVYDNIVVADAGNNRVQIFDRSGNYKYSLKATVSTRRNVVPRSVCVVQDKLVVLFTGEEFGEVRVYNYLTADSQSKTCKVQ